MIFVNISVKHVFQKLGLLLIDIYRNYYEKDIEKAQDMNEVTYPIS